MTRFSMAHLGCLVLGFILLVAAAVGPAHAISVMSLGATGTATGVLVHLSYYEDPASPTGHPEWVGYDIRRSDGCSTPVTLNAQPFARTGGNDDYTLLDVPPAGQSFRYDVVTVDAARNQLYLGYPACDPCWALDYSLYPPLSGPSVRGTIRDDWVFALLVEPCAGSCDPWIYVSGPEVSALRPYLGTGQAIQFFGEVYCGTVEGCTIELDHWTLVGCDIVPTRRQSWGALKTMYR